MAKQSPINAVHEALGAQMVAYAGWRLPMQYKKGIVAESLCVREHMGLFDVSHMGEIEITGRNALQFVQKLCCNDASKLKSGQIQYSAILNESGFLIDDCTVYCLAENQYMVVVNASQTQRVLKWFQSHAAELDCKVQDRSQDYALMALQGPKSNDLLSSVLDRALDPIKYYEFGFAELCGSSVLISRTGYTGEDGFELYVPWNKGAQIFELLLEAGTPQGLQPIGLGARDVLRLESGYLLSGTDFNEQTHVLEAGLSWIVNLKKGNFIGKDGTEKLKKDKPDNRIRAVLLKERGIARSGYAVAANTSNLEALGSITSGTHSPSLQKGVALAMLDASCSVGDAVKVQLRNKWVDGEIVKAPFVQGSVRKQK